jgi:hypothetical protein
LREVKITAGFNFFVSLIAGYVLMQRIFPLPQKTAFLRAGALQVLPSISELGVYGTYLAYGTQEAAAEGQQEGRDRWVECA